MKWLVAAILAALILAYASAWVIFSQAVSRKAFRPPAFIAKLLKMGGPNTIFAELKKLESEFLKNEFEPVSIKSSDGLMLKGNIWKADMSAKKIVLLCHGCKSHGTGEFANMAPFYHKLGFDVVLIDHRASGKSEGKYITYGKMESKDTALWVEFLARRYPADCQILLHGVSMGAATVLMMSDVDLSLVKAMIADCAYTTCKDEFAYLIKSTLKLPNFPLVTIVNMLCKAVAGFDIQEAAPINHVSASKYPILFIHGKEDAFVPFVMEEALYNAANCDKEIVAIDNATHAMSYYTDSAIYEKAVNSFLNQYFK